MEGQKVLLTVLSINRKVGFMNLMMPGNDFALFKQLLERRFFVWYVKPRSTYYGKAGHYRNTYKCHRHGNYVSREREVPFANRKRRVSKKVGCRSRMSEVGRENNEDLTSNSDPVKVLFEYVHQGHCPGHAADIRHLPLARRMEMNSDPADSEEDENAIQPPFDVDLFLREFCEFFEIDIGGGLGLPNASGHANLSLQLESQQQLNALFHSGHLGAQSAPMYFVPGFGQMSGWQNPLATPSSAPLPGTLPWMGAMGMHAIGDLAGANYMMPDVQAAAVAAFERPAAQEEPGGGIVRASRPMAQHFLTAASMEREDPDFDVAAQSQPPPVPELPMKKEKEEEKEEAPKRKSASVDFLTS